MADDEGQQQRRHELGKPDHAQREGTAGQPVDLPADGDGLHLEREVRKGPRQQEQREGTMAQDGTGGRQVRRVRLWQGNSGVENRLLRTIIIIE